MRWTEGVGVVVVVLVVGVVSHPNEKRTYCGTTLLKERGNMVKELVPALGNRCSLARSLTHNESRGVLGKKEVYVTCSGLPSKLHSSSKT